MAGASGDQNDIVWPGYVAAMASLLLSLLLVCAVLVMTIGQIGSIIESYEQSIAKMGMDGKDIERLAQLAGISDEQPEKNNEAEEKKSTESPEPVPAESPEFTKNQFAEDAKNNEPLAKKDDGLEIKLDLENGLFNLDAAKQAAALAASDRALLAQIDLSKVDVRKIRFKGLDFSGVQLNKALTAQEMKKIDFKDVDFGKLSQERINKLKPILAKEAVRFEIKRMAAVKQAAVQTPPPPRVKPVEPKAAEPAPPASPPPPPAPKPAPIVAQPETYKVVFSDETVELGKVQKQTLLQWVERLKQMDAPVRIWAEIPAGNDALQRSAYTRLVLLRGWVIEGGIPANMVQVNLESVPGNFSGNLTFHMAPVRR